MSQMSLEKKYDISVILRHKSHQFRSYGEQPMGVPHNDPLVISHSGGKVSKGLEVQGKHRSPVARSLDGDNKICLLYTSRCV